MNRKLTAMIAAPALGAALTIAAAAPAMAAVPTTNYNIVNDKTSVRIIVDSNPSNYGVRAEGRCTEIGGGFTYHYGPWVFSPGAESQANTNCDGNGPQGSLTRGYFQYKKSAPIRVQCWDLAAGDPLTGFC